MSYDCRNFQWSSAWEENFLSKPSKPSVYDSVHQSAFYRAEQK